MKQQLSPPITELLNYARLAPSVHNTQPWKFIVDGSSISIAAEPKRMLDAGDPTSRETWISFGICLETLLQAAKGLGMKATITHLQTATFDDIIATVSVTPDSDKRQESILSALEKRHTYREKMEPTEIAPSLLDACQTAIEDLKGVSVLFMQDRPSIKRVGNFTFKAMSLALSSPDFRNELYELVHYNWSPSRIGMHGYVLGEGTVGSVLGKWSIKLGTGIDRKARQDQQRVLDASALIFIATKGDVPSFWLRAGQGYMRVALEVAKSGLAQATLAAPIEAASFHEDIEKMLHTSGRIQTMLKVGKATHTLKRTSPRLEVSDLT